MFLCLIVPLGLGFLMFLCHNFPLGSGVL
jgi:hypothetical protein